MEFFHQYTWTYLSWIGIGLFLSGMQKGGFPIGAITVPMLILVWPHQAQAARSVVGFMLPMLFMMDIFALLFYRHDIDWGRVKFLLPATVVGVALASVLFVSDETALIAVSDRVLKICIGVLGVLFVIYFAIKKFILQQLDRALRPGWQVGSIFGFAAGVASTMAHASGPVWQMYLLPQHLPKKRFVATGCIYYFILNLMKLVSFSFFGRIHTDYLKLGAGMFPVIPLGVAMGWWLTKKTREQHYVQFIYIILFITSCMLIFKGCTTTP